MVTQFILHYASYIEMFLLSHLFKILIFIGIIKIKNKNFLFEHKSVTILIIALVSLIITSALMIVGIINNNLSYITFIFFVLSVSVFVLLIILGSRLNYQLAIKELEISHLKSMIDTKNAYYKDLLAYEKKISKLKHDFKNQVTGIIASGDKLEDKLMELAQELNLSDIRYSNNPLINAILNSKLKDLEIPKENKTISVDIKNMINIDPGDFGILLGNSLDNCVEALNFLEPERRYLKVDIHDLANMVLISIENTYDPKQEKEGDNRGFGLKSINEIATKYNGLVKIEKGSVFRIEMSFINNKS